MFGDIAQDLSGDDNESLSQDSAGYMLESELEDVDAATRADSGTIVSRDDLQEELVYDVPHVVDFNPSSADQNGGTKFLLCLSQPLRDEIRCRSNDVYVRIGTTLCPAEILEPGCVLRCFVPPLQRSPSGKTMTLLTVQAVLGSGVPISKAAENKFQYIRQPRILDTRIPKKRSMLTPARFHRDGPGFRDFGMASPIESRETKIRIVERLGSLTSALPNSSNEPMVEEPGPNRSISADARGKLSSGDDDCSFKPLSIAELPNWDDPMAIASQSNRPSLMDASLKTDASALMPKSSDTDDEMLRYFSIEAINTTQGNEVERRQPPEKMASISPMCVRDDERDLASTASSALKEALRGASADRRVASSSPMVQDDDTLDISMLGEAELENVLDGMLIRVIDQLVDLEDTNPSDTNSNTNTTSSSNLDLTWLSNELNAADESGNSLLHYCCAFNIGKLMAPLLRYATNVNMRNNDGDTPLHIACRGGCVALVEKLLQSGARPGTENYGGKSAYDVANESCCDQESKAGILDLLYQFAASAPDLASREEGPDDGIFSTWLKRSLDEVSHSSEPVVQEAFQSLSLHDKCALQLSLQIKDEATEEAPVGFIDKQSRRRTSTSTAADSELQTVISNCGSDGLDKAISQMSNEERSQLEKEARMIARNVKAWFTQRQYMNLKSAATTLQLAWRAAKRREAAKAARRSGQGMMKSETPSSGNEGPMALSRIENERIKRETLASLKIQRALLRWRMNNQ
uniref:Uncharacterized protein n=2 Tax=Pinguiococcus pyrenoidosus TaxID=172671 RepID=A0A7R9UET6_9STRA